jgi:hypothetical protein
MIVHRRILRSTTMFQPPKSLIDAVRQKTLVPFIGAGMSVGVRVRSLPLERRRQDDGLGRHDEQGTPA